MKDRINKEYLKRKIADALVSVRDTNDIDNAMIFRLVFEMIRDGQFMRVNPLRGDRRKAEVKKGIKEIDEFHKYAARILYLFNY